MKYIDIHGHYAWGIDDGIQNLDEAKKALQIAAKNNIVCIVATPHLICGKHNEEDIKDLKSRILDLKILAKNYRIEVIEGCELFLNDELHKQLDQKLVIPFEDTQYLLCEFDVRKRMGSSSEEFEDILYEVIVNGYTPIVAHVERYFKSDINIDRIQELIEMGCIIQINSTSLLNDNSQAQKNAYSLLNHNLVHVIASDTHQADGKRCPNLEQVYQMLTKKYDEKNLQLLFYENPLSILKNQPVLKTNFEKKGFFSTLLKRR